MITQEQIDRINTLANKSKTEEGLTPVGKTRKKELILPTGGISYEKET